jgi:hypothetical protein
LIFLQAGQLVPEMLRALIWKFPMAARPVHPGSVSRLELERGCGCKTICLLDEPTSALDQTRATLVSRLETWLNGRTAMSRPAAIADFAALVRTVWRLCDGCKNKTGQSPDGNVSGESHAC